MVNFGCRKISVMILLLPLLGCVTTPDSDFFDASSLPVFENNTCVKLDILKSETSILNSQRAATKIDDREAKRFGDEFAIYGLKTDCADPIKEYTVTISLKMPFGIFRASWGMISIISLGIVPYFDTHDYEIMIQEKNRLVAKQLIPLEKKVSIIYIAKMYEFESRSNEIYKTSVGRAILTKEIIRAIANDLRQEKVSPKGAK